MAKNTKPLFSSSSTTWSWSTAASATKTSEAIEINDYPPSAHNVASIVITGTTGSGAVTGTVYCYLGFGFGDNRIWGPAHTIEDTSGQTSWSLNTTETSFEANLYAQTWWALCDAVKIVISFSGSDTVTGDGAICVQ